jgi:hypothetical protein
MFSNRRNEYISLERIINRGKETHSADNRFINDENIKSATKRFYFPRVSNDFVSKATSYRLLLLTVLFVDEII